MRQYWIVRRLLLAVAIMLVGCEPGDFGPLLDMPISPVGKVRSAPFRIYRKSDYWVLIGLDSMQVDEATCKAATGIEHPTRLCNAIVPSIGPFTWTVIRGGKVIAQGSGAMQSPVLPTAPADWAKDKKMSWLTFGGFFAQPGDDYVIQLDMQTSPDSLQALHPRLAIMKRSK